MIDLSQHNVFIIYFPVDNQVQKSFLAYLSKHTLH